MMAVMMVCACASKKEDTSLLSAETLYTKGYRRLNKADYEKAAEYFEKVEIENDSCDIYIPIEQTVDSGVTEEELYDEAPEKSSDLGDELIQMLDSILQ